MKLQDYRRVSSWKFNFNWLTRISCKIIVFCASPNNRLDSFILVQYKP